MISLHAQPQARLISIKPARDKTYIYCQTVGLADAAKPGLRQLAIKKWALLEVGDIQ